MNVHVNLAASVSRWNSLKAELAEVYGLDFDDDALPDTIDGECDLGDQLAALIHHAREQELFAAALDQRIAEYKARRDRLERSAQTIRSHVAAAAIEAGLKKLPRPEFTLSFGFTKPSLQGEIDPAELPDELCRVKREANRTAIREAIEAGQAVPGYRLSNGKPQVRVTSK